MSAPGICILSTVHLCFDVRMFQAEARTLAKAGFDLTLIALEDPTPSETEGIHIFAQPRPRHRLQRMLGTLRVLRLAKAQPVGLYIFHDPELLPAALLLKLFTGRRLVYDVHEDVPASIRNRAWLPRPLRPLIARFYQLFEGLALPFIDGLTLADHAYQKYYRGRHTLTVLNYPLTTYADLYEERQPGGRPTLVYAGSITALRGLYEMIELVRRLRQVFPDLLLRLVGPVGSAAEKTRAEELITRHDLGGHVEFTGLVSHLEVHRQILAADVGLALLHPDPNYINSLPTKMFEYMMMGRPVVVSNFPMWAEIVAEAGCGYAPHPLDLDAVEQHLRRLLGDVDLRREMGRRGRAAVLEKYNWKKEGERLVEFYRALLKEDC
ncbi:MAG: glycosyltransferase [Candidatus Latescibacteria bacterium]|nr:glycosyltransferase [Candidatus Latescibacterota bacterium]